MPVPKLTEPLYFGCKSATQKGHFTFVPNGRKAPYELDRWCSSFDGKLTPPGQQIQGQALLHHFGGEVSAIAFWDRSADKRGNSNAAFFVPGHETFEGVLGIARNAFPWVFERFDFEIAEAPDA